MGTFRFYGPHELGGQVLARRVWEAGLSAGAGKDVLPDFRGTLVILPGMRAARQLRYLWLEMAEKAGRRAVMLPKMLGLHDFVQKLPLERPWTPITAEGRVLRLAEVLSQVPLKRLMPGAGETSALGLASFMIRGLDDLIRYAPSFNDLLGRVRSLDSLDPSLPATLRQLLSDSVGQAVELQVHYLDGLHQEGLDDPVYAQESDARAAALSGELVQWAGAYGQVWVGLFQDATAGELELLAALAACPNVTMLLPTVDRGLAARLAAGQETEAGLQRHPSYPAWRLQHAVGALGKPDSFSPDSYWAAAHPLPGQYHTVVGQVAALETAGPLDQHRFQNSDVVECEDPFHEAMTIAWRAAEVVQAGGTMLVAVPSAESARLLESLLEIWDIACESTFGKPLAHTPILALLRQLDELVTLGFPYQVVCGIFSHPLCRLSMEAPLREVAWQLEREVVPYQKVTAGLERLTAASKVREEVLRDASTEKGAIRADYSLLRVALERLQRAVNPLVVAMQGTATVPELASLASTMLEEVMGSSLPASALGNGDVQVLERLQGFSAMSEGVTLQVEWREFLDLFMTSLAGVRVHEPRNREVAVVITDPSQARFLERDVFWFAGLSDGDVPGSEPSNPLLPNDARQVLGLMGSSYAEALAAMDFMQAWLRPGQTCYSYVRQNKGTPTLRSRFLERIAGVAVLKGIPTERWLDVRTYRTLLPSRTKTDFSALRLADWPEPVSLRESGRSMELWATELESYSRCPYQFFCRRELGLKPPEEIQEVLTAQELGTLVHEALRAFYDSNRRGIEELPGPWVGGIEESNRHQAEQLLSELFATLLARQPSGDLESKELRRVVEESVPDIIEAEMARWAEGFVPWRFETDILYRPLAGQPIVFKSRCDRVDRVRGASNRVAILDYKTGTPPAVGQISQGLRPQLFVAALGLEQELAQGESAAGSGVEQVHYYRLKLGQADKLGTPAHRGPKGDLGRSTATMLECLDGYRQLLTAIAQDLLAPDGARFPAIPGEACTYCAFQSVCRKEEVVK